MFIFSLAKRQGEWEMEKQGFGNQANEIQDLKGYEYSRRLPFCNGNLQESSGDISAGSCYKHPPLKPPLSIFTFNFFKEDHKILLLIP